MLLDIHLLNRAVKRRCRKMVYLLLHYCVSHGKDVTKVYLFPPNVAAPGGVTPLHLAASMQDSEDIVDALTNDPREIGLKCWNSLVDENDQSPYMYAVLRNNLSCNRLVARKLADRTNDQVTILVEDAGSVGRGGNRQHLGDVFYQGRTVDSAARTIGLWIVLALENCSVEEWIPQTLTVDKDEKDCGAKPLLVLREIPQPNAKQKVPTPCSEWPYGAYFINGLKILILSNWCPQLLLMT
ncbi:hypothetical protein C4D60_Mb08t24630 [Musa balbisiana]|uniref:Uncharacterized protein n=1 Tax=Musa balbisiana TaxID=52838 RepID=A0A4S8K681_MUSBA|nr:hypothetical protein C4D60_Mb08t24630 [Musa balbisiana]